MKNLFSSLLVLITVGTAAPLASAHFKLLAPMPTLVQHDQEIRRSSDRAAAPPPTKARRAMR